MKRQVLTPYINIFENKGMFLTGHLSLNIKKKKIYWRGFVQLLEVTVRLA